MTEFDKRHLKPMLIGADGEAFDSGDFIYELKWDGERCLAYLDPDGGTELRNKRNLNMLPKVPELAGIHKQVRKRCILDGELMIMKDGRPDFYEIQRRSLTTNSFKIQLASRQYPASFVAFDILFYDEKDLTLLPLMERKKFLEKAVMLENSSLAISRYVPDRGRPLYLLAEQKNLEGIVAKRKNSIYVEGKRTKDWIKIKNLKDDDFVVCGYIYKENGMISLVLGQYDENRLVYKGHVTLGTGGETFEKIRNMKSSFMPPFEVPSGNEEAKWILPELVCTVKFMDYHANGGMRQPVFKGLRFDKTADACVVKTSV